MLTASIVTFHHSTKDVCKVVNCILSSTIEILYIIDNSSNDALREFAEFSKKIQYIHSLNVGYG